MNTIHLTGENLGSISAALSRPVPDQRLEIELRENLTGKDVSPKELYWAD